MPTVLEIAMKDNSPEGRLRCADLLDEADRHFEALIYRAVGWKVMVGVFAKWAVTLQGAYAVEPVLYLVGRNGNTQWTYIPGTGWRYHYRRRGKWSTRARELDVGLQAALAGLLQKRINECPK